MKIIYVVGAGRSGSTLLDMALGQAPEVFSCGELSNITDVVAGGHLCSCEKPVPYCGFWQKVLQRFSQLSLLDDTRLNHSRRILSWIAVWGGDRQKKYIQAVDELYSSISEQSGSSTIVDSSKSPVRLAALLRHSRHEIVVVHLVRHPGAVAESLSKPLRQDLSAGVQNELGGKRRVRTYAFWTVINILVHLAMLGSARRYVRVKYEDFTGNPTDEIIRVLGEDGDCFKSESLELRTLERGHIMAGNRMRLRKDLKIQKPPSAKAAKYRFGFLGRVLTFPLLRFYGY